MPVKHVMLAMAMGGLTGLGIGGRSHVEPDRKLLEAARAALTGDRRSSDVDRALHTVDRFLEQVPGDFEAAALKSRLQHQQLCRQQLELAEHALVNHELDEAQAGFRQVDPSCELYDFARTRLQQFTRR